MTLMQNASKIEKRTEGEPVSGLVKLAPGNAATVPENAVPLGVSAENAQALGPILHGRQLHMLAHGGGDRAYGIFVPDFSADEVHGSNEVLIVPFDGATNAFDPAGALRFPDDGLSINHQGPWVGQIDGALQISYQTGDFVAYNGGQSPNASIFASEAYHDQEAWAFQ